MFGLFEELTSLFVPPEKPNWTATDEGSRTARFQQHPTVHPRRGNLRQQLQIVSMNKETNVEITNDTLVKDQECREETNR